MKLIEKNGLRKLVVDNQNNFIANIDFSDVAGKEIYLGIYDSPDNYVEVDETKRNEIIKAQEELAKLEQE